MGGDGWWWGQLELLRAPKVRGVILSTNRLGKSSGIIRRLFLAPFWQQLCIAWHLGPRVTPNARLRGISRPSWCGEVSVAEGKAGFLYTLSHQLLLRTLKDVLLIFHGKESPQDKPLWQTMDKSCPYHHPGIIPSYLPWGLLPTTVIKGKSGVSSLRWTRL